MEKSLRIFYFFTLLILLFSRKAILVSCDCSNDNFVTPNECFDLEELRDFASTAQKITKLYNDYVGILTEAKFTVDDDEAGANLFYGGDLPKAARDAKYAGGTITTFMEIAARYACKNYDLNPKQLFYCLNGTTADFFDICEPPEEVSCDDLDLTYRPLDGICVNQDNPYWGAANTAYTRLMNNSYDDNIHEIRTSMHENSLPSARTLSTGLRTLEIPIPFQQEQLVPNDLLTFFLNQITFDIAKTLKAQTWDGNYGFECCDCNGRDTVSSRFFNHNCFPIEIPDNDKYFRGQKCMNYIRALMTHDNCKLKESSILNTVTHFLDLDYIYSPDNVKEILKYNGGTFSTTDDDISHYVLNGDERNMMFPQMFAISAVFIKFHNVVFNELHRLYPQLDTTVKFYETRRFVIALYQHIVYLEVLPTFLSPQSVQRFRLVSMKSCYRSNINPSISSEFVSSAFRYLHTYIQNGYHVKDQNNQTTFYKLRDIHYNISLAFSNKCELFKGLMETPWNSIDIAEEPSNYLFGVNGQLGLDLRAMDFHAERDFGVATYCDALKHFRYVDKDKCFKKFTDYKEFITDAEKLEFIKCTYEHPCDVDLGVGASLHEPGSESILSPIFEEIVASQFEKIKCGDRYFFTNEMSDDQVDFLKQFGFKDVLCLANGNCGNIQPFVFLTPHSIDNPLEPCNVTLNLENWQLKFDLTAPTTTTPPTQSTKEPIEDNHSKDSHDEDSNEDGAIVMPDPEDENKNGNDDDNLFDFN